MSLGPEGKAQLESRMHMYTLLDLNWITNKDLLYSTGHLLNVMWHPGREGSLGENGYMYMYGRVPLLSVSDCHNIVRQLYSGIKLKI